MSNTITLNLPDEFIALCQRDDTIPELVLINFVADLCGLVSRCDNPRNDGYISNGSDECMMAREYYNRVGYPEDWRTDW